MKKLILSALVLLSAIASAQTSYWISSVTIPEGNKLRHKGGDGDAIPELYIGVEQDGKLLTNTRDFNKDIKFTQTKEGWSVTFEDTYQNWRILDLNPENKAIFSFIIYDEDVFADDLVLRIDNVTAKFIKDSGDEVIIYEPLKDADKSECVKIILKKKWDHE